MGKCVNARQLCMAVMLPIETFDSNAVHAAGLSDETPKSVSRYTRVD
jgi:hypothetical protein